MGIREWGSICALIYFFFFPHFSNRVNQKYLCAKWMAQSA